MVRGSRSLETSTRQMRGLFASARNLSESDRRRAEDLLERAERGAKRLGRDFYDVSLALLELDRRRLFESLGYATLEETLRERGSAFEPDRARRIVAIADTLTRDEAEELGVRASLALARRRSREAMP